MSQKSNFESQLTRLNTILRNKIGTSYTGYKGRATHTISEMVDAVANSLGAAKGFIVTWNAALDEDKSLFIIDPDHNNQVVGTYSYYRLGELLFIRLNSLETKEISSCYTLINFPALTFDLTKSSYSYILNGQSKLGGEIAFSLTDSNRVNLRYYLNSDEISKDASNLKYAVGQWFCLKVFSFIEDFENYEIDISSGSSTIIDNKNNELGTYSYYKLGKLIMINFNSYTSNNKIFECTLKDFPVNLIAPTTCSFSGYADNKPFYENLVFSETGKLTGTSSKENVSLSDIMLDALNQQFIVIGN